MTISIWPRGSHLRAAALVCMGMCALAGCQRPASPPKVPVSQTGAEDQASTEVITVAFHDCPLVVRVQGSLIGDEQAVVGARQAGRIKEVNVDLGSVVRRGDVLASLHSEEFDLRVRQAEAQLLQSRAALGLKPEDPDEKLNPENAPPVREVEAQMQEAASALARAREIERRDQNLISKEVVQQREAALAVATARKAAAINSVQEKIALIAVRRAELAIAIQAQADAKIIAPFDGVLQDRHVAPGVFVSIGQSVVTLVRTNPLRFRAGVPERDALAIKEGLPLAILLEGVPQPIPAQISRISPALDMGSRSLIVEADVPNAEGRYRAGLFAEAEIVIDARAQALAIPGRAISQFAGVEKVMLLRDGKAKEIQISTGRRVGEMVEVLSGLKAGDEIVVESREAPSNAE
jgi:RND family efflux transporter MFP subunit